MDDLTLFAIRALGEVIQRAYKFEDNPPKDHWCREAWDWAHAMHMAGPGPAIEPKEHPSDVIQRMLERRIKQREGYPDAAELIPQRSAPGSDSKPPTQTIEATGDEMTGYMDPRLVEFQREMRALATNPQFQAWIVEVTKADPSTIKDAELHAFAFIIENAAKGISPNETGFKLDDVRSRFLDMQDEFADWLDEQKESK